jgi:hypothetical protein
MQIWFRAILLCHRILILLSVSSKKRVDMKIINPKWIVPWILITAIPVLIMSCYPGGPSTAEDLDIVGTSYDKEFDFSAAFLPPHPLTQGYISIQPGFGDTGAGGPVGVDTLVLLYGDPDGGWDSQWDTRSISIILQEPC